MPSRTSDHFVPEPLGKINERMLITRWLRHNHDEFKYTQNDMIARLNKKFGTTMRATQMIRWRIPHNDSDAARAIHISLVEYIAVDGGICEIFKFHGVSTDPKLQGGNALIWYKPNMLIKASIRRVATERMTEQVKSESGVASAAKTFTSLYEYVSLHLDIILECLDIVYDKKALTPMVKRTIASEIYSIVGLNFNPAR
jgi:hypothetical protein